MYNVYIRIDDQTKQGDDTIIQTPLTNVYFFKKEWVMNKFGYEWSQFICVFIDAQNYNQLEVWYEYT